MRHCEEPLAASEAWREATKQPSVFLLRTFSGLLRFARNDEFFFAALREVKWRARSGQFGPLFFFSAPSA